MNLESVKEESREIFIEFTNGMCEAMALGKKSFLSIVNDAMRLQWLSGMTVSGTTIVSNIVEYGAYYNWYVITNMDSICASSAHVPTNSEWEALITFAGGHIADAVSTEITAYKFIEAGTDHWSDDTGTDDYGFGARGAGFRGAYGEFLGLLSEAVFLTATEYDATHPYIMRVTDDTGYLYNRTESLIQFTKYNGFSVRLIVDAPIEIDGVNAIYVGNDDHRYHCILINGVWWLAENLAETRYSDGSLIPVVSDNVEWVALTTGGMCFPPDDEYNSHIVFSQSLVNAVDNDSPTLAIEKLRHYKGKFKNVDLSQIGVITNPSTDPSTQGSDLLRSGSQQAVIGANAIMFSSPLGTVEYTVNVWIIGDGESQYDLGEITKATNGFTVSDALIEGTLYYQVIVVI